MVVKMSVPAHRIRLVPIFADIITQHHGAFDSLLDLGCGELHAVWRQRWGTKYEGLDIRDSVGADYVGDACDLSMLPTNSRDVVTGWSILEHVTHPYNMLTEAKRVSRGTVILSTDFTQYDKNYDNTHLYSWTIKTLTQLVKKIHPDSRVYANGGSDPMLIVVMCRCYEDWMDI